MTGLDIFAWIVLIVLILALLAGFIVLAMLPGKIARQRNHPQSDAINVAGWVGALGAGIFWPLALIWAFTRYRGNADNSSGGNNPTDGQEARS